MTRRKTTKQTGYVLHSADPVLTTVKPATPKTTMRVEDQMACQPTYEVGVGMVYNRTHPKTKQWLALQERIAADRNRPAAVEISYTGLPEGRAA